MNKQKTKLFLIKLAYWLGIGADALWAIGLLCPPLYGALIGEPDFSPDLEMRLVMGIGATLMTGWTFLLLWALRKPIERRFVILLTAFPGVFGLSIIALIGFLAGNSSNIWILGKSALLIISMVTSYILAGKMDTEN